MVGLNIMSPQKRVARFRVCEPTLDRSDMFGYLQGPGKREVDLKSTMPSTYRVHSSLHNPRSIKLVALS